MTENKDKQQRETVPSNQMDVNPCNLGLPSRRRAPPARPESGPIVRDTGRRSGCLTFWGLLRAEGRSLWAVGVR